MGIAAVSMSEYTHHSISGATHNVQTIHHLMCWRCAGEVVWCADVECMEFDFPSYEPDKIDQSDKWEPDEPGVDDPCWFFAV